MINRRHDQRHDLPWRDHNVSKSYLSMREPERQVPPTESAVQVSDLISGVSL